MVIGTFCTQYVQNYSTVIPRFGFKTLWYFKILQRHSRYFFQRLVPTSSCSLIGSRTTYWISNEWWSHQWLHEIVVQYINNSWFTIPSCEFWELSQSLELRADPPMLEIGQKQEGPLGTRDGSVVARITTTRCLARSVAVFVDVSSWPRQIVSYPPPSTTLW